LVVFHREADENLTRN